MSPASSYNKENFDSLEEKRLVLIFSSCQNILIIIILNLNMKLNIHFQECLVEITEIINILLTIILVVC